MKDTVKMRQSHSTNRTWTAKYGGMHLSFQDQGSRGRDIDFFFFFLKRGLTI